MNIGETMDNKNERSSLIASIGNRMTVSSIHDNNNKKRNEINTVNISTNSDYDSFHNNINNSNDHSYKSTYRQFYSTFIFVAIASLAIGIVSYNNSIKTSVDPIDNNISNQQKQYHTKLIEQLGSSHTLHRKHDKHEIEKDFKPILQATHGLQLQGYSSAAVQMQYEKDLEKVNWDDVKADLASLLKDSKDWWPADYGSYGPLMIRLSWHTCGSYRTSDGRGGCDGGSQRYDPERSWPDNTNLDKARTLLQPIKLKYGNGVSWGDLFALVGTVAIHEMGGPHIGFCAGRQDVQDNTQTLSLGPSLEQEQFSQCPINGQCQYPLGANTVGLIYVNPEGPMGEPDVAGAAYTVRDVFGRMDWHGRELVALIGGGHTFGKAHGASTQSNGLPPNKCPFGVQSWDGPVGVNAITSGFEGPWTSTPLQWDNHYFQYLDKYDWEPIKGPGGHYQWQIKIDDNNNNTTMDIPMAPSADPAQAHDHSKKQNIMMLTTDVALKDDDEYRQYVTEFANNETAFKEAFAKAWYKLVTRDVGPISRCAGTPPDAYHFQKPLPDPPKKLANIDSVTSDLVRLMKNLSSDEEFVRLAYQCASTYRATDYSGGCNGARIRFPPGSEWPINAGLAETIQKLTPIKDKYGDKLSYADLFVLSGNVAAERIAKANGTTIKLNFCPGRTDDSSGTAWDSVSYGNTVIPTSVDQIIELLHRRGQTYKDFVALTFIKFKTTTALRNALSSTNNVTCIISQTLQYHPEVRYWAEKFSSLSNIEYGRAFTESWTRLMNADRFDGPVRNLCG